MITKNREIMKWIFTTMLFVATIAANAQYVTYNHDSPKMNQITVEETGAGSLKPELYYTLLHNKYKKTADCQEQTHIPHGGRRGFLSAGR